MRHRFHSICPYFAMFPETFVEKHLAASPHQGAVFGPFCGGGTTVFQALLQDRAAAGSDVNPVAACIAGAKCDPPGQFEVEARVAELYWDFLQASWTGLAPLLAQQARLVVRIGGRRLDKTELREGLVRTLEAGLRRGVRLADTGISSRIGNTQANAFRGAKASPIMEHDFAFTM